MDTSSNYCVPIHQHQHHQLLQHHHQEQQHDAATPFQPNSAASLMMTMQTWPPSFPSPISPAFYHQNIMGNKEYQVIDDVDEGQVHFLYLHGQQQQHQGASAAHFHPQVGQDHQGYTASGMRPPTLSIFPSLSIQEDQTSSTMHMKSNLGFAAAGVSCSSNSNLLDEPSIVSLTNQRNSGLLPPVAIKLEDDSQFLPQPGGRSAPSSERGRQQIHDPKTLRRLAQNREAARKSRLRKKAYIQQLESCRIKLLQLEQELLRSRALPQGYSFSGDQPNLSISLNSSTSDAVVFDVEYGRWLEEHHKLTCELRTALIEHQFQLQENELRMYVNNWLVHFNQLIQLKSMVAKTDPFHLLSGSWKSPAERCFLWIGGFRPSHLIQIISKQIEPLSDDQQMGVYELQSSMQEAEKALSNGLESLCQSISNTMTSDSLSSPPNDMTNYMSQMAIAVNKLSSLEGFVRQADNLRQNTIHRLHQILTVRQSARCFLTISEYFLSLRALSSMWLTRPRQE